MKSFWRILVSMVVCFSLAGVAVAEPDEQDAIDAIQNSEDERDVVQDELQSLDEYRSAIDDYYGDMLSWFSTHYLLGPCNHNQTSQQIINITTQFDGVLNAFGNANSQRSYAVTNIGDAEAEITLAKAHLAVGEYQEAIDHCTEVGGADWHLNKAAEYLSGGTWPEYESYHRFLDTALACVDMAGGYMEWGGCPCRDEEEEPEECCAAFPYLEENRPDFSEW